MHKIVILGCGYLGYNIAMKLQQLRYQVTVVGLRNDYTEKLIDNIKFIEGDLSQITVLDSITLNNSIVINCIGSINSTNKCSDIGQDLNVYNLLTSIMLYLNRKKIKKFIQISSGGTVYGMPFIQPIKESIPTNPLNIYALQKVFIEEFLKINFMENNLLPYCILRVGNPYGGYQTSGKQQGIIPIVIEKALKNQSIKLWSSPETVRDYIYISDLVDGIRIIIENGNVNETYNLSSGIGIKLKQIITLAEKFTGNAVKRELVYTQGTPIKKNLLDITKISSLGFSPRVNIIEGMKAEVNRIKYNHTKNCEKVVS